MEPVVDIELIHAKVLPLLAGLSPEEKRMAELRYGLFGEEPHTQAEIAEIFGFSQQIISYKIIGILKKIRNDLAVQRVSFTDFV